MLFLFLDGCSSRSCAKDAPRLLCRSKADRFVIGYQIAVRDFSSKQSRYADVLVNHASGSEPSRASSLSSSVPRSLNVSNGKTA